MTLEGQTSETEFTLTPPELTAQEKAILRRDAGFSQVFDLEHSSPGSSVYSAWMKGPNATVALKVAGNYPTDISMLTQLKQFLARSGGQTAHSLGRARFGDQLPDSIDAVSIAFPDMFPINQKIPFEDRLLATRWIHGTALEKSSESIKRLVTTTYLEWVMKAQSKGVVIDNNIGSDILVVQDPSQRKITGVHIDPMPYFGGRSAIVDQNVNIAVEVDRLFNLGVNAHVLGKDDLCLPVLIDMVRGSEK